MSDGAPFPTQAQIKRAVKAAEAAGLFVSGIKIETNGAIVVFASQAPSLASPLLPGEGEPNDFD